MVSRGLVVCVGLLSYAAPASPAAAQESTSLSCPRPSAGAAAIQPPALFSRGGALNVTLDYVTSVGPDHRTRFCFVTPDGQESPTLHVSPGDTLNISLTNRLPPPPAGSPAMAMGLDSDVCGAANMTSASVNMHFHGTNTSPTCHSDEVVHTLVNSGQTFNYSLKFPGNEPPGLYLYHPHVHPLTEKMVLGGADGAIVVEGLQKLQPAVAGLPSRILIIRDQTLPSKYTPGGRTPSYDVTLNYVPISYPALVPAVIHLSSSHEELWRVANGAADTVIDLRLLYDGVVQPLRIVALDGVPTDSQDGTQRGKIVAMNHVLLAPTGRAEFIVTTPSASVKQAIFETTKVDTGPIGDNDTRRTLAILKRPDFTAQAAPLDTIPTSAFTAAPFGQRFAALDSAMVTTRRTLYFSESPLPNATKFFITVVPAKPELYHPGDPPAIVTHQGAVEEWTVENRSPEVHEFHIHQIHFKLLRRDGKLLPPDRQQFFDVVNVPYWSGKGPYPSVTLLMDFRGPITGDFVYHCHILNHEDQGMMAIIRVLPRT
ncbi:MAG: multicopper oxidase family protein [Caulobacteraceae bacterium]